VVKRSGVLTGTAGVYFVASQLAAKGFHAAPTFGNAPHVDILVGLQNGAATLSIQVKTTWRALRIRGRGKGKVAHHYEWNVGERSARLNQPGLFFAFVDLKGMRSEMPDVFIVPSETIYGYFKKYFETGLSRWRWHPRVGSIEQYRNNWKMLEDYLNERFQQIDYESQNTNINTAKQ
jgi:hypothetical protein